MDWKKNPEKTSADCPQEYPRQERLSLKFDIQLIGVPNNLSSQIKSW